MKNLVVHCQKEPFDIYIGRANARARLPQSKWANPYVIPMDGDRKTVIEKYERRLSLMPELMNQIHTLRGQVLGCWCAPEPCHGDVLARLANKE